MSLIFNPDSFHIFVVVFRYKCAIQVSFKINGFLLHLLLCVLFLFLILVVHRCIFRYHLCHDTVRIFRFVCHFQPTPCHLSAARSTPRGEGLWKARESIGYSRTRTKGLRKNLPEVTYQSLPSLINLP